MKLLWLGVGIGLLVLSFLAGLAIGVEAYKPRHQHKPAKTKPANGIEAARQEALA
jgi:Na+-transporting methylmalonyl-CoA/oxaloacetate decarboxylase gamma subunit